MASIKDVAKYAGVSITTVSRALNNYQDVSPVTKQRILEICRELKYTPNSSARNLALKQTKIIGLLFSDMKETDMNGNIIFRLLQGVQSCCDKMGYELMVLFTNDKKQEQRPLEILCRDKNIGGIVIYGLKSTDTYFRELGDLSIPCVGIDVDKAPVMVGTNNDTAVGEIIQLLYDRGRRRIGMINGAFDAEISRMRETAFIRAMRSVGLQIPQKSIRYADFFEEKAYEETKKLLEDRNDLDAIFAASDLMAIGVIRALKERGIRVPEDIAVAGIDGIQVGEYIKPPLTTIFQDFKAMGYKAASLVIEMQNGNTVNYIEYVPHKLIIRESI